MRFFHNSHDANLVLEERDEPQGTDHKPHGFWFDADGDWLRWCGTDSPEWIKPHHYEVWVPSSVRLLHVRSVAEIDAFHAKYAGTPTWCRADLGAFSKYQQIDWERIAKQYDGIVIAPYLWERRLERPISNWYYTWDCASGCVWRKQDKLVLVPTTEQEVRAAMERAEEAA